MRRVLALLTFLMLLALPAFAQVLNPGGGIITQGGPTTAVFPPGPVSIIGNRGNGTDQITGIANLNGVRYCDQFAGADIGAKCNAAISSLGTQGGRVHIPYGNYSFTTTIQCPLSSNTPIIIEGDGRTSDSTSDPTATQGTLLSYGGTGDAINQFITATGPQNYVGCQLRDLTLEGNGLNNIGFHVGGTAYTATSNVSIRDFGVAGIELEDAANRWTERYEFRQTNFIGNAIAMYFHNDPGGQASFFHGKIDVFITSTGTQRGLVIDGGGGWGGTDFKINGNSVGTGALISVLTGAFAQGTWMLNAECQASPGPCIRFNVDSASQVVGEVQGLQPGGGTAVWIDSPTTVKGVNLFVAGINQDRVYGTAMSTCGNAFSLAAGASRDMFTVQDYAGFAAGQLAVKSTYPGSATNTLFNVASSSCSSTPSFSVAQSTQYTAGSPFTITATCNTVSGGPTKPVGSTTYTVTNNVPGGTAAAVNTSWSFLNMTGFDPVVCY